MYTKIRQMWNNKCILFLHIFADAILLAYSVTFLFSPNAVLTEKYFVISGFAVLCAILEIVSFIGKKAFLTQVTLVGGIYHAIRPVAALIFYYMSNTKMEGMIFLLIKSILKINK